MSDQFQLSTPPLQQDQEKELQTLVQLMLDENRRTQLPPISYIGEVWREVGTDIVKHAHEYRIRPTPDLGRKVSSCWRAASRWGLGIYVPPESGFGDSSEDRLQAWHAWQKKQKETEASWDKWNDRAQVSLTNGRLNDAVDSFWNCAHRLFALGALPKLQVRKPLLPDSDLVMEGTRTGQKIPSFHVALHTVSGQQRFKIKLMPRDSGGQLEGHLQPNNADHTTKGEAYVFLVSGQRVFRFQEATWKDHLLRARLFVSSPTDFGLLRAIISKPGSSCRLVARSVVNVATQTNHLDVWTAQTLKLPEDEPARQKLLGSLPTEIDTLEKEIEAGLTGTDLRAGLDLPHNITQLQFLKRQLFHLRNTDALYARWPHVFDRVVEPRSFTFAPERYPYIFAGDD